MEMMKFSPILFQPPLLHFNPHAIQILRVVTFAALGVSPEMKNNSRDNLKFFVPIS